MQNAKAMLYCPNYSCQTLNPESHKFCQKCRTPLIRRYLWAVREAATACQPGDSLGDRYLCKGSRIFLDTKPGLLASNGAEVPEAFQPYLRLSPYRLHVPQIYDWVKASSSLEDSVLLLDQAPLRVIEHPTEPDPEGAEQLGTQGTIQIAPSLAEGWQGASALRQLNWLWQIAQLWQPLSDEQATFSLLEPGLLRTDGALLRLLELRFSTSERANLAALGQFWLQWVSTARSEIVPFLEQLCQRLIQGQIYNAELLTGSLDEALAKVGQAQRRQIHIATYTDQGPSRQRNEDACYPVSGTVQTPTSSDTPLVIVCDGIGGHQGGDVASHLAIATVEQLVNDLTPETLDPTTLSVELEKIVCIANDQISERNDSEQRYDRQRMGTTLVMGLVRSPELYITHVGDSRAYWITRWGCHQVTLDDDVASREVRLGYSAYRQALQQPGAGSLVQALGMGSSSMLRPTVQRFLLDEDSIFLLCSDGLSDNDRVEEVWETQILPLLDGKTDLATVGQCLVETANARNGYDNVTVGLIYCQVVESQPVPVISDMSFPPMAAAPQPRSTTLAVAPTLQAEQVESAKTGAFTGAESAKTRLLRTNQSKPNPIFLLSGIIVLLGLGGLLGYLLLPSVTNQTNAPISLNPEVNSPASSPPAPTASPLASLDVGTLVQLKQSTPPTQGTTYSTNSPPVLLSRPESVQPPSNSVSPSPVAQPEGSIPVGSILEVLSKQGTTQQERWVQLRICSTPAGVSPEEPTPGGGPSGENNKPGGSNANATPIPTGSPAAQPSSGFVPSLLQPGKIGWIREAAILPLVASGRTLTPEQQGVCIKPVKPQSSGTGSTTSELPGG
jgi:serine/threonine protein phosphatase PrpC